MAKRGSLRHLADTVRELCEDWDYWEIVDAIADEADHEDGDEDAVDVLAAASKKLYRLEKRLRSNP